jgi:hypothetical protein
MQSALSFLGAIDNAECIRMLQISNQQPPIADLEYRYAISAIVPASH